MTTAAISTEITIDIPAGPVTPDVGGKSTGWNAYVILDPEARSVSLYTHVGSGTPMHVWHRRATMLRVPASAGGEELADLLETNKATIAEIFEAYEGSHFDGSNTKGQWSREEDGPTDLLRAKLDEVATYWSASDWLEGDSDDVKRQVRKAGPGGLDALAKEIVGIGACNDALLSEHDVRSCLNWYVERIAEEDAQRASEEDA